MLEASEVEKYVADIQKEAEEEAERRKQPKV